MKPPPGSKAERFLAEYREALLREQAQRPLLGSLYRETDSDAHAEDVWHVRYDGQDFRDG